jgi:hypothetical protein
VPVRSLVLRSSTECGVYECGRKASSHYMPSVYEEVMIKVTCFFAVVKAYVWNCGSCNVLALGNINNFKFLSGSLKMCLELIEGISYRKLIESDLLEISLMCIYRTATS